MEAIRNWFWDRPTSERYILGVLGAALVAVVLIFGIYLPLSNAVQASSERYAQAVINAARVEAKLGALNAPKPKTRPTLSGPIEEVVGQSAAIKGFSPEQLVRQDDKRVSLTIPAAQAQALYMWLAELEQGGIQPEALTVTPQGDGILAVQATLRRVD
jgi:type II secretory pathway component PulM